MYFQFPEGNFLNTQKKYSFENGKIQNKQKNKEKSTKLIGDIRPRPLNHTLKQKFKIILQNTYKPYRLNNGQMFHTFDDTNSYIRGHKPKKPKGFS